MMQACNERGLISSEGDLTINGTCIINNEAKIIVAVYNGHSMTIMNSYADHPSNITGIVAQRHWLTGAFINEILMLKTGKCIASFDSFGSITAGTDIGRKRKSVCYKSAVICKRVGNSNELTRFILFVLTIQLHPSNAY